jgi:hypothetical protein
MVNGQCQNGLMAEKELSQILVAATNSVYTIDASHIGVHPINPPKSFQSWSKKSGFFRNRTIPT